MTDAKTSTRTRILDAAYTLFYRQGFARVSMDMVAAEAGVTKRTLYYHFESKDALAGEALGVQDDFIVTEVDSWGLEGARSAADLRAILLTGLQAWARNEGWTGSGFSRLTMELADLKGHPARLAATKHKHALEARLRDHLARVEAPEPDRIARQMMITVEGAMTLALIHNDVGYLDPETWR